MFVMCRCLCCVRWILIVFNSVFLVFSVCGRVRGVKVMLRMYVISSPPCLCFLSVLIGV